MSNAVHPIRVVAERTGLSPHVIRAWQRRYGTVEPDRSDTNRRRYSEAEIERLTLLRRLTEAGQSIGYIARLPTEELQQMTMRLAEPPAGPAVRTEADFVQSCLAAIRVMDRRALEQHLTAAEVALGAMGLAQRVAAPVLHAIGDEWEAGTLAAAHEHFASAVLRAFLARSRPYAPTTGAPVVVVATPTGQLHEFGALLVASIAGAVGWDVLYLGASLPAGEIALAARRQGARAVALSIVYPPDDPQLEGEIMRLDGLLGPDIALLIGGRASTRCQQLVANRGVAQPRELAELPAVLAAIRAGGDGPGGEAREEATRAEN